MSLTKLALALLLAVLSGCTTPTNTPPQRAELHDVNRVVAVQQRGDWCWAACAEMSLKYNGVNEITQETLVHKFKDGVEDQRANELEIIRALAADPPAPSGQQQDSGIPKSIQLDLGSLLRAASETATIYTSSDSAIEDFVQQQPVVVGLVNYEGMPGHVVFLTAVSYWSRSKSDAGPFTDVVEGVGNVVDAVVGNSRYKIDSIEFFDPRPEGGGSKVMTGAEVDRHVNFWISRDLARSVVEKAEKTMRFN